MMICAPGFPHRASTRISCSAAAVGEDRAAPDGRRSMGTTGGRRRVRIRNRQLEAGGQHQRLESTMPPTQFGRHQGSRRRLASPQTSWIRPPARRREPQNGDQRAAQITKKNRRCSVFLAGAVRSPRHAGLRLHSSSSHRRPGRHPRTGARSNVLARSPTVQYAPETPLAPPATRTVVAARVGLSREVLPPARRPAGVNVCSRPFSPARHVPEAWEPARRVVAAYSPGTASRGPGGSLSGFPAIRRTPGFRGARVLRDPGSRPAHRPLRAPPSRQAAGLRQQRGTVTQTGVFQREKDPGSHARYRRRTRSLDRSVTPALRGPNRAARSTAARLPAPPHHAWRMTQRAPAIATLVRPGHRDSRITRLGSFRCAGSHSRHQHGVGCEYRERAARSWDRSSGFGAVGFRPGARCAGPIRRIRRTSFVEAQRRGGKPDQRGLLPDVSRSHGLPSFTRVRRTAAWQRGGGRTRPWIPPRPKGIGRSGRTVPALAVSQRCRAGVARVDDADFRSRGDPSRVARPPLGSRLSTVRLPRWEPDR